MKCVPSPDNLFVLSALSTLYLEIEPSIIAPLIALTLQNRFSKLEASVLQRMLYITIKFSSSQKPKTD